MEGVQWVVRRRGVVGVGGGGGHGVCVAGQGHRIRVGFVNQNEFMKSKSGRGSHPSLSLSLAQLRSLTFFGTLFATSMVGMHRFPSRSAARTHLSRADRPSNERLCMCVCVHVCVRARAYVCVCVSGVFYP